MSAAAMPLPQLPALTGLRGIAAWLVVFYHLRLSLTDLLPPPVIAVLAKGYLAVDLFFMLSGFVLWYNYAPRLRTSGLAAMPDFLWRRVARIWPLHAALLAAFIAFVALLAVTGRNPPGYPLAELPLHFLLLQNWGFTAALAWNHPAWSISTELAAYILFAPLVCAVRWEKLSSTLLVGLLTGLFAASWALFDLAGATNLGADISRLGLPRCLIEFCAGNLLCILWQRWREVDWSAGAALAVGTTALLAGTMLALPETAFVPAAFASGLLALALGRGVVVRALGRGAVHYLGEISYATYLSHFLLFLVFKLLFVGDSLQLGVVGLAGMTMLLLGASVALYHGIEKPAQRWLNARRPGWLLAQARPTAL